MMGSSNENVLPKGQATEKQIIKALQAHLPFNYMRSSEFITPIIPDQIDDYPSKGITTPLRTKRPEKSPKTISKPMFESDLGLAELGLSTYNTQRDMDDSDSYKEMRRFKRSLQA
jgi:hypothetical protein